MATHSDPLLVEQGADFVCEFPDIDGQGRPRNRAGWRVEGVVRHSPDSPEQARLRAAFTPGKVTVTVPGGVSAGWAWQRSRYEIRLIGPQGQRERFAAGRVLLDRSL